MYKNILLPLDNSEYSNFCIDLGISLAKGYKSHITGSHVYAARLHDNRFKAMESGLPPKYQEEKELQKQRDIHDDLITKGLQIISDSYLDVFENRCKEANIPCSRKMLEGKNYLEIVNDVQTSDYDLVIIGFLGLGQVKKTQVGSVCERVVRRIKKDVLVMKSPLNPHFTKKSSLFPPLSKGGEGGLNKIVVAIDGSPNSFAGLKSAIGLARIFNSSIACISAFDPNFHYAAFKNIAGVLSDEAGKIFKFKEQERLHEEIIDKGLAKIYQDHLDTAKDIAKDENFEITTELLTGKAFEEILKYVEKEEPDLLVMGRVGVHAAPEFRLAKCNILISGREFVPPLPLRERDRVRGQSNIIWTKDALDLLEKIPAMAKGIVKNVVTDYAVKKGYKEIDIKVMQEARKGMG
ncbi:MAG: universal stress protein [Deltaproteobacteria bacterium]|nr:universal stress protein [Deltaproteobacteria bacterium]